MEYIVRTRSGNLNVRSGPGENYTVVGSIRPGTRVDVIGSQREWRKLNGGGWVHANYLHSAAGPPSPPGSEDLDDGIILPHPRRPGNPHWRILAGFDTASADLKPAHQRFLLGFVANQARAGQWVWLRGLASHRGHSSYNRALAIRRAQRVRDFLTRSGRVPAARITGSSGIGEDWSRGPENDNSPEWRAVEVIVTDNVVHLPGMSIGADTPLSSRFYIKYMGSGSGGEFVAGGLTLFLIRTPNSYWQRYGFVGGGIGVGAPVSWGEALPAGQGWVTFSTPSQRTLDSFEGTTHLVEAGAQVGSVGWSGIQMDMPGVRKLNVPTGPGFSLGASEFVGRLEAAGDLEHSTGWQRY